MLGTQLVPQNKSRQVVSLLYANDYLAGLKV